MGCEEVLHPGRLLVFGEILFTQAGECPHAPTGLTRRLDGERIGIPFHAPRDGGDQRAAERRKQRREEHHTRHPGRSSGRHVVADRRTGERQDRSPAERPDPDELPGIAAYVVPELCATTNSISSGSKPSISVSPTTIRCVPKSPTTYAFAFVVRRLMSTRRIDASPTPQRRARLRRRSSSGPVNGVNLLKSGAMNVGKTSWIKTLKGPSASAVTTSQRFGILRTTSRASPASGAPMPYVNPSTFARSPSHAWSVCSLIPYACSSRNCST